MLVLILPPVISGWSLTIPLTPHSVIDGSAFVKLIANPHPMQEYILPINKRPMQEVIKNMGNTSYAFAKRFANFRNIIITNCASWGNKVRNFQQTNFAQTFIGAFSQVLKQIV